MESTAVKLLSIEKRKGRPCSGLFYLEMDKDWKTFLIGTREIGKRDPLENPVNSNAFPNLLGRPAMLLALIFLSDSNP